MSAEENEALVRRYFEEAWDKGNLAAVDEFIAPNYIDHTVPPNSGPGRDTLKQFVAMYHDAFPDVRCTLHEILAQGDKVAYRWSGSGTHLGEWAGIPPTGLHMTMRGITILRIVGGRVRGGLGQRRCQPFGGRTAMAIRRRETNEAYLEGVAKLPLAESGLHHDATAVNLKAQTSRNGTTK